MRSTSWPADNEDIQLAPPQERCGTVGLFSEGCGNAQSIPLQKPIKHYADIAIERAYDELHRTQAVLAYLSIVKRHVPGINQFLEEAKSTYNKALLQHQLQDYEGARECASASRDLSRVVEIVIARTLRSDTTYPSIVPPPPEHAQTSLSSGWVEAHLNRAESALWRIQRAIHSGSLPSDQCAQVRRIASWGAAFRKQALRLYGDGFLLDAIEMVQAAKAAAHSAERICRKAYVAK